MKLSKAARSYIMIIVVSIMICALFISVSHRDGWVGKRAIIVQVHENSPGDDALLRSGDIVISLNGKEIGDAEQFVNIIDANRGLPVILVISRGGRLQKAQLVPRLDPPPGQGGSGLVLYNYETESSIYELINKLIKRWDDPYMPASLFLPK